MSLFSRHKASGVANTGRHDIGMICPLCQSNKIGLGVIDHIERTVRHRCSDCGYRWADGEIDLVRAEVAARRLAAAKRAVRS
jgi:hypothetical protein